MWVIIRHKGHFSFPTLLDLRASASFDSFVFFLSHLSLSPNSPCAPSLTSYKFPTNISLFCSKTFICGKTKVFRVTCFILQHLNIVYLYNSFSIEDIKIFHCDLVLLAAFCQSRITHNYPWLQLLRYLFPHFLLAASY